MLSKVNNKLQDLIQDINNIKVKEEDNVYDKLCDVRSDIEEFQRKVKKFSDWVESGIRFLGED